jgi:Tfp pilus assembly protein PilF
MNFAADPDTLVALAAQDVQKRELAAAEAKVLGVLERDREHTDAWTVLGMLLQAKGQRDEAIRIFHSLTSKHPAVATHWENLGAALREARRLDEALSAYERAVALAVPGPHTLYNIGLVQMERLDFTAAHAVLRQALELAPRDAWIRCAYSQCCYDLGRLPEAAEVLEGWQSLDNLTPTNMAEMAHLLVMAGEPKRGQAAVDWLTEHPPQDPRALLTLANIQERLNRLTEARAALECARAGNGIPASDTDLVLTEAVLAQREGHDEEAERLLTVALAQPMEFARRHSLLFPLAQSLEALGRHGEAFTALVEAHQSQLDYLQAALGKTANDPSAILALTLAGVDREDRACWNDAGVPSLAESPIFIVGFPRSGTTLLEQVLDAHPALVSMDEQPFLNRAIEELRPLSIAYPAELGKLGAAQLQSLRAGYWKQVDRKAPLRMGQRLVDKNPFNLLRLPLIHRLFPNARTVLVVRHPCDVLLSCFFQHFRAPDLALLCRDLETLAQSYRRAFDFWYRELPLIGAATYELKYERFVDNLEGEARQLAAFLELPWDDALLSSAQHARAKGFISTPSYTRVIEPVSARPVGRWHHYERQFRDVLAVLEPYLERWGR